MLGGDREYITLDLGANGTSGNINGLNGTAVAHAFWLHEVIFSGGVKKGGTWGGPECAAHVDYETHVKEVLLWMVLSAGIFWYVNVPQLVRSIGKNAEIAMKDYRPTIFWKQVDFLVAAIHFGMWLQVLGTVFLGL
jgi:hypothetical protein